MSLNPLTKKEQKALLKIAMRNIPSMKDRASSKPPTEMTTTSSNWRSGAWR
jgi:hypothetical protein